MPARIFARAGVIFRTMNSRWPRWSRPKFCANRNDFSQSMASGARKLSGARTLAVLRDAGATALRRHLKVPRREVRAIVVSLVLGFGARSRIESLYRDLAR